VEFFRKAEGEPKGLAVFPGSYHPPTLAHVALGQAALSAADEVVFVLPRGFPHKRYERVGFRERMRMLLAATEGEPRFSVAASEGGLFIEIARECRAAYGSGADLWFLCGCDAAERVVNWPYGGRETFVGMLEEFGLLVADRGGHFEPPEAMRQRIRHLPVDDSIGDISATTVRRLIADRLEWRHLVPDSVVEIAREIYE